LLASSAPAARSAVDRTLTVNWLSAAADSSSVAACVSVRLDRSRLALVIVCELVRTPSAIALTRAKHAADPVDHGVVAFAQRFVAFGKRVVGGLSIRRVRSPVRQPGQPRLQIIDDAHLFEALPLAFGLLFLRLGGHAGAFGQVVAQFRHGADDTPHLVLAPDQAGFPREVLARHRRQDHACLGQGRKSHQSAATVTDRPTPSDRISHDDQPPHDFRLAAASEPCGTAAAMAPVTVPRGRRTGS
jgi:hypothetical protein